MSRKRAALDPAKVKPLFGAKRPLPIIERNMNSESAPLTSEQEQQRRYIQGLASERASDKRLGAEGVQ